MEAIILAAGLGTRLRPLTDRHPKALVEVDGCSLLQITIERLVSQGVDHIVVNAHHFSDQIRHFVEHYDGSVHLTLSDESDRLLDTGGALRRIATDGLLRSGGPYILHNVDILSRIDLSAMVAHHSDGGAIATLAVSQRATDRQLLFDTGSHLCGWHNRRTDEYRWSGCLSSSYDELAYSGIAVLSSTFMHLIASNASEAFSLTDFLLHTAGSHPIDFYQHLPADWLDVGKPETLARAASFVNGDNH